jgi:hypothetical protein
MYIYIIYLSDKLFYTHGMCYEARKLQPWESSGQLC